MKCRECESDGHLAALHPGPPLWGMGEPSLEHGGEGEEEKPWPAVTSRCTEVCDEGKEPRSCSKICLVKIYPKGRPDKTTEVYVILDDQSNRSLAKSEFFNLFQIRRSDSP